MHGLETIRAMNATAQMKAQSDAMHPVSDLARNEFVQSLTETIYQHLLAQATRNVENEQVIGVNEELAHELHVLIEAELADSPL